MTTQPAPRLSAHYLLSPEFHRNLWLQFTPARIIAVPVLVALGAGVTVNATDASGYKYLIGMSLFFYWLVAIVWGSSVAGSAVQDEVRNNTWDFQRTSSIGPIKYAFGKLFGVTAYVWYFALMLYAVFAVSYFAQLRMDGTAASQGAEGVLRGIFADAAQQNTVRDFFYMTLFMLLAGVFAHACAFYEGCRSLARADKWKGRARWRGNISGLLVGLSAGTAIMMTLLPNVVTQTSIMRTSAYDKLPSFTWMGMETPGIVFALFTILFFLGWALVAIVRFMQEALLYKIRPVAWPLFVATTALYFAGLIELARVQLSVAYGIVFFLTYVIMFRDALRPNTYRRLYAAWQRRDRARIIENLPLWATSALMLPILFVAALGAYQMQGLPAPGAAVLMISALLFAVRDGCVVHGLFWRGGRDRFMVAAYFIIVYILLPRLHVGASFSGLSSLFEFSSFPTGGQVPWVLATYIPTAFDAWHTSIIPPLLEVIVAALFLKWTIKDRPKN